ncbi:OmpP1/FadL family transporter [Oleidesulfovibrio sp.]|uniref:OmpP1/FadL family transporter n=1 Tax=Oleidesulfovibrio sp. TaxID=2909707 RepID=UPI003A85E78B
MRQAFISCCLAIFGFLLCIPYSAEAAGFAMYEFSARGNALGGAMVARDASPSSIAFNPALITQLEGTQLAFGMTVVDPQASVEVKGHGVTDTKDNYWAIPHAYATRQINDNLYVGVGMFSRFGLGNEYPKDWFGKDQLYYVGIQSLSVNPVMGLKLSDQLSVAFGIEAMWFDYEQKNIVDAGGFGRLDGRVHGESVGYGVNLGVHYQPVKWLALGASWRSEIKQNLKGNGYFSGTGMFAGYSDTDARGSVNLPDMLSLGICFMPTDRLSIEVGAVRTGWTSYDKLAIDFNNPAVASTNKITEWKDVWRYNIGVEYALNDMFDLRAGYVYDNSPLNENYLDYLVPANDRHLISGGVGIHQGPWTLDLSYTYLMIKERTGNVNTRIGGDNRVRFHDGNAHLVGMTLGYKF